MLQFPVGDPAGGSAGGGFGISRPAFRGFARTGSGWLSIDLDGLHIMLRPAQPGTERSDDEDDA